jgi:hypothetical protein
MRRFVIVVQLVLASLLLGAAAAPARRDAVSPKATAAAASNYDRRIVCHQGSRAPSSAGKHRLGRRGCRPSSGVRDPGPASGPLIVGLNADVSGWGGASTAPRLDEVVSQTGTRWLREEFVWSRIEPRPGLFDFSYYDHFMLLAVRRGEHILPLLYETPSWDGPAYNAIPSDPVAFAEYVAAVIRRYGPHGSFWTQHPGLARSAIPAVELWNEPFSPSGDDGVYDPARYARLVKAAAIAAHAVDPAIDVLLAAEMQSGRDAHGDWQWWVNALYKAVPDLNHYFDGVAMHDYGADTRTLSPMVWGQPYQNYGRMLRIDNLRRQFVIHGAGGKPFWITEVGWSTCTQPVMDCVSEAQQAANLATLFNDARGPWSNWVHAVFVYRYADGSRPSTVQDAYGLTRLDGSPKPALSVFRHAVQRGG